MLAFMQNYVTLLACHDPTSESRHMPSTFRMEDMYTSYLNDDSTAAFFQYHPDHYPMSISKMQRLWSKHFSDVKLPHQTRLGKCDECFALRTQLDGRTLRHTDRLLVQQNIQRHLALARNERLWVHATRNTATPQSGNLSKIFDGARDTAFPCLYPTPKMFADRERLMLPLYGVICHTFNTRRLYIAHKYLSHDVNFVITSLAMHICELMDIYGTQFPRKRLYLQADNNTTSQNKNCYVIAFIGLLVHLNIFEEVHLSMLPPGHTHEDIHAMFGHFSHMRERSFSQCFTLPDMQNVCREQQKIKLFTPESFQLIAHVLDWKAFLVNHCGTKRFEGITQYHVFKVARAASGEVQLIYKDWNTSGEWRGGTFAHSNAVKIFEQAPLPLSFASARPSLVPPPSAIDPQIVGVIDQLIVRMEEASVADTARRCEWFAQFKVPPARHGSAATDLALKLFSPLPALAEEAQPAPVPPPDPRYALGRRQIVARPHPPISPVPPPAPAALPDSYRNRSLSIGDLVIVAKNPGDENDFPDDLFWIASVLEPLPQKKSVRIRWYNRVDEHHYHPMPDTDKHATLTIKEATILFSGFQLTQAGRLFTDFATMVQHEITKQK